MKNDKLFITIFLIIIFGILLLYPVNYILVHFDIIKISNLASKTYEPNNGLFSNINNKVNSIKVNIENKSINYFPLYDNLNSINKKVQSKMNNILYNVLNIKYYPVGTNNDGEYVFRNNEKYIIYNNLSNEELDKRLNNQITFFNNLDIDNLYIFIPYRYEYLNLNNDVNIRDMNNYRNKFINGLNSNIKYTEFRVDSEFDYNKYFYHTDHHYNMYGALKSYDLISDMMNLQKYNYQVNEENIKYLGSMAKSASLNDISDKFYTSNFNLKNHNVLVNGKINELYKSKKLGINKNEYYDQYVKYYNGLFGEVKYDFNEPNKKNLLIFEDSYGWQIDELIASNYNTTHIIELRYYDFSNFNLKNYMKENNIDEVLFIYEAGSLFFDQYDYNMIGKVN